LSSGANVKRYHYDSHWQLERHLGDFIANCSIPDVCIDERRLPLFIARATLRGLIAVLEARTTGDAAL
jgi:hypothetical protein